MHVLQLMPAPLLPGLATEHSSQVMGVGVFKLESSEVLCVPTPELDAALHAQDVFHCLGRHSLLLGRHWHHRLCLSAHFERDDEGHHKEEVAPNEQACADHKVLHIQTSHPFA